MRTVLRMQLRKFHSLCRIPCEWTFSTKFACVRMRWLGALSTASICIAILCKSIWVRFRWSAPQSSRYLARHLQECFMGSPWKRCGECFSAENKEHPKTQHTRKRRKLTVPKICVFGCVAFSGALCSPLRGRQNTPENATHPNCRIIGTVNFLRFQVCCVFGCFLAECFRGHPESGPGSAPESACELGRAPEIAYPWEEYEEKHSRQHSLLGGG